MGEWWGLENKANEFLTYRRTKGALVFSFPEMVKYITREPERTMEKHTRNKQKELRQFTSCSWPSPQHREKERLPACGILLSASLQRAHHFHCCILKHVWSGRNSVFTSNLIHPINNASRLSTTPIGWFGSASQITFYCTTWSFLFFPHEASFLGSFWHSINIKNKCFIHNTATLGPE